ncbi:DUF4037 domain-containing protein [Frankia canadensis]|uniref:DUF4037 domain-containing protein n=1 Tax=Frankia canadensis TaxID=1836972 RepID=UPI001FAFC47B|nr:DUF4037 domain-containing protein [Frankia canadensis]
MVRDDPLDLLTVRRVLAWYPDDVWRCVLAAGWLRVSQEQPFVGRTSEHGGVDGAEWEVAVLLDQLDHPVEVLASKRDQADLSGVDGAQERGFGAGSFLPFEHETDFGQDG